MVFAPFPKVNCSNSAVVKPDVCCCLFVGLARLAELNRSNMQTKIPASSGLGTFLTVKAKRKISKLMLVSFY